MQRFGAQYLQAKVNARLESQLTQLKSTSSTSSVHMTAIYPKTVAYLKRVLDSSADAWGVSIDLLKDCADAVSSTTRSTPTVATTTPATTPASVSMASTTTATDNEITKLIAISTPYTDITTATAAATAAATDSSDTQGSIATKNDFISKIVGDLNLVGVINALAMCRLLQHTGRLDTVDASSGKTR